MSRFLVIVLAVLITGGSVAQVHASAGADARDCGYLAGTGGVLVTAYSVPCGKADRLISSIVQPYKNRLRAHHVRGYHRGFSCRGTVGANAVDVSCRRDGGRQFVTARGQVGD
jgi:hypothetical protein